MRVWKVLFLFSLIICSCSTQPMMSKEAEWLVDYVKASHAATAEPAKACEMYLVLANQKDFVLTDVAHVRSLRLCDREKMQLAWDRPVPAWLEKERGIIYFQTLLTSVEKALYVQKNPQFFQSPERIQVYQTAIAQKEISAEDKKTLQEALYNISPRFMPDPQDKDLMRIVKDLKSVREFTKARSLLNKMIVSKKFSTEEKFNAHKELFYVNKLQRDQNRDLYMRSAKSWANFIKPNNLASQQNLNMFYEAQLNYIRVLWTRDGAAAALKELDKLQKHLHGRSTLYEIYWLRGRMWDEQKKYTESIEEIEKAAKEQIPQWREKEKIVWSLAWSYFKSQKYAEAEGHLASMIDAPEVTAYARFKYMYWKGEAQKRQNKNDEALKTWEQLAGEDVFGYYNLLAHSQLNKPLKEYRAKEYSPQKILSTENERTFYALQKVEEFELASRLVSLSTAGVSLLKDASADYISSFFYLYAQIKNYKYIFSVFNQLPYELQKEVFLKIPNVLYPHPYDELMTEAQQKTQMEPELLYSIMRQESSFDPRARSPMDAFGLLQLLPEVGKRIASENKIEYNSYEDLYDEKKNIDLGSRLLRKQAASFKHRFVLFVASYNASSSAVRNWHSRFTGEDDLMFIEDIPYEETKAYVKLVLRNYIVYKKLRYGDEFKTFPREILALKEPPSPESTEASSQAPPAEQ